MAGQPTIPVSEDNPSTNQHHRTSIANPIENSSAGPDPFASYSCPDPTASLSRPTGPNPPVTSSIVELLMCDLPATQIKTVPFLGVYESVHDMQVAKESEELEERNWREFEEWKEKCRANIKEKRKEYERLRQLNSRRHMIYNWTNQAQLRKQTTPLVLFLPEYVTTSTYGRYLVNNFLGGVREGFASTKHQKQSFRRIRKPKKPENSAIATTPSTSHTWVKDIPQITKQFHQHTKAIPMDLL